VFIRRKVLAGGQAPEAESTSTPHN
jgi:hypothetical protein